jgi:hypothetical protein
MMEHFSRFAKGGVLGGQLLPNLRYLGTNYLTAPAIVYSTLGGKYAAVAAKASLLCLTLIQTP